MCKEENSREYKHEHRERLCYCCDKLQENESDVVKLSLGDRGYGSTFDGTDSYIQLCKKCLKSEYIDWFNETPEYEDYCEEYKYEDNIRDLVNSFILENQEYFWNSNCHGWTADHIMNRQDWLDMENGIMPDEKYKYYHMYSPSEVKAYKDRFPTCDFPINIVYKDGSKGCRCICGAFGEYGQKIGLNISNECYNCPHYIKREHPLIEISSKQYEKLEKKIYDETTQEKLDKLLKEKFEKEV